MQNVIMSVGQAIEWGSLLEGTKVEFWHGNYPVADKVTFRQQSRISLSVVMYIQVLNSLLMLLRQVSRGLYLFTDMYSHTAHLQ